MKDSNSPARRIMVIPDTQVRPGVDTEQINWAANAIVYYKPDVVVHVGDHWDMMSLMKHEQPGHLLLEGTRYRDDVAVGNEAFRRLDAPMAKAIEAGRRIKDRKVGKKRWRPRRVFLFGNHEHRITRAVEAEPKLTGALSLQHLDTRGWERHPFLTKVWIDGIVFSHYFQQQNAPSAIAGTIDNRLNRIGDSFVQGHQQGFWYGNRVYPTGKIRHGLVAGSFYLHDEGYKGPQANDHWRGIVVLNDVHEGDYEIMPLSMRYLKRKFS